MKTIASYCKAPLQEHLYANIEQAAKPSSDPLEKPGDLKISSAEQAAKPTSEPSAKPTGIPSLDLNKMTATLISDAEIETSPLQYGSSGFAVAQFKTGMFQTEVPNLMLDKKVVLKKPAAKKQKLAADEDAQIYYKVILSTRKSSSSSRSSPPSTPSSKDPEAVKEGAMPDPEYPEDEEIAKMILKDVEDENVEKPEGDKTGRTPALPYISMWYKNWFSIGIRRKFGDRKQIFCFGGKTTVKTEQELKAIGKEVIRKMVHEGLSEADAKLWAKRECIATDLD